MKLSDYVAEYIQKIGVRHVFVVTGGAVAHLIDSVDKTEGIEHVCTQHEQGAAMAADAYSRATGNIGVAMATSGPGATNLITGCCCAYYDSVPVLYITGQVSTSRLKRSTGVRQMGFQETDVVEMFRSVTKYAVLLEKPDRIRYELEKAVYLAREGRPGPVLLDIPDDLQRVEIEPEILEGYQPDVLIKYEESGDWITKLKGLILAAQRPVVIAGWGVYLAGAAKEMRAVIEKLQIPVVPTWGALDLVPHDEKLLVGSFGLHGTRYGNFAVQNADLIIAVGTRLDTHLTGTPVCNFARAAKKVLVDIDLNEIRKFADFGVNFDLQLHMDAKDFLQAVLVADIARCQYKDWLEVIANWKKEFPICPEKYYEEKTVNPYVFIKKLAQETERTDVVFIDTGCGVAWTTQAFEFKDGQRLFSAFNNTPMGYALPAALGASFALNGQRVICISGDGGLHMNIQELTTAVRYQVPVKIFLLNNKGYAMIQQTQDQWLDSRYIASSVAGGLGFPDFIRTAEAYGFTAISITCNEELQDKINAALSLPGPVFCNIEIDEKHRVIPQVVFGRPIEDAGPLLEREVFLKNMLVEPLEVSLEQ